MPWYQPCDISPPSASYFKTTTANSRQNNNFENHDDFDGEFEFGQENVQRAVNNNRRGATPHSNNDEITNDALTRRLCSLFSPMIPPSTTTSIVAPTTTSPNNTSASMTGTTTSTVTITQHHSQFLPTAKSAPITSLLERTTKSSWGGSGGNHYTEQQEEGEWNHDLSSSTDHNETSRMMMFSPYPHPSFPHRETPIPPSDELVTSSSFGRENEEAYFFYPHRNFSEKKPQEKEEEQNRNVPHTSPSVRFNDNNTQQQQHDAYIEETMAHNGNSSSSFNQMPSHNNHHYDQVQNQNHQMNHGYGIEYTSAYDTNNTNQQRMKQTRLTNNLETTLPNNNSQQQQQQQQESWAHVGQIGIIESENIPENESKKKKKRSKKKKTKKKRPLPDLRAMLPTPPSETEEDHTTNDNEEPPKENDDQVGDDEFVNNQQAEKSQEEEKTTKQRSKKKKRTREKSKKTTTTTTTNHQLSTSHQISEEDLRQFAEHYDIKNAGASEESLSVFQQLVKDQRFVTWSIIFHDENCTTPFLPSVKKYCTPKGPPCTNWNCTCDNQVRATQASKPLVGVMFVFPMEKEEKEEGGGSNDVDVDCFLLPLGPTIDPEDGPKDIDQGYERMANWPFLPILCETTLEQRWSAFRSILMDRNVVCATYNVPLGLMPYHYHCANDFLQDNNTDEGPDVDLLIPQLWDLRLASWMLAPHLPEEELEFEKKCSGFPHLRPNTKSPPNNTSKQMQGLIDAKNQLEFLYAMYPIVDKILVSNGLKDAFDEIESPVQSILSSMECNGIGFKVDRLVKIQSGIESRIEELSVEARNIAKDNSFMLSSPQQVSQLLFVKLGIKAPLIQSAKAASSGKQHQSTSEETLKAIQQEAKSKNAGQGLRIVDIILEFRGLSKVLNTYIKPYPHLARSGNSQIRARRSKKRSKKAANNQSEVLKIYPMWMQTAVRTGRLSCRKPNMQQIPTGSVLGVCPRNAFTSSSKGRCLFAFDYSQNEVRILAHMSNDKALLSLFDEGNTTDIYKQMSSITTGKSVDLISDEERSVSKQVTLAIMYGMGLPQVAKKLGVNKAKAKAFFDSFYGRFRGVKMWMDQTKNFARKNHYVKTISGRRRYLDNINSSDSALKTQAERQAVNSIIQGSAADLMKLAMLKMASRLMDWKKEGAVGGSTGIAPKMLLQIHDELVLELMANKADVDRLALTVKRCCADECAQEFRLKVPLSLKCSVGSSWGNMKEFEV